MKIRWELPVETEDKTEAEIRVHDDYDQASIRIREGYEEWTPEHANVTIVHELLHTFERGSKQAVSCLDLVTKPDAFEMIWHRYLHESENWIDRLAIILVDLGGLA